MKEEEIIEEMNLNLINQSPKDTLENRLSFVIDFMYGGTYERMLKELKGGKK